MPRLSQNLTPWDGSPASTTELQGCLITEQDFSEVKHLFIDDCIAQNTIATGAALKNFEVTDATFTRFEAAALRAYQTNFLRVEIRDSRLTGADFPEAVFKDCTFKNVKCDESGFRFARFERVRFENCVLSAADFAQATLSNVTFSGCELDGTNFAGAHCKQVGFESDNLSACKGIVGLKGATISSEQLVQIAPLLAAELGFNMVDS